mmetsp:Transcript_18836/g.47655  ORF Transcript_18836/g.47655 Transcript_18836/m.47655 type:complete len:148 (-) Transcript_18836:98-541(-)|eukprot:CAMPEP_0202041358 /NCGR_PEP_ID=MMETSP0962-20130828/23773_1 /ASSEMBLY_ACC=CAM_ASM_000488 /TAXON_ID=4773 /ORGANISM="Schizochytrium aggregatum, Strain ATCC28209" /LENGTH=147 /DNA_ID=CAMNT_0048605681 /DNA_START=37 /DNA_END=480 /DNA_ORIENTATION=+
MSRKIVVCSGYFDPMHFGHIEYLEKSKDLGDKLIVIVNSDKQAAMKKGQSFMPANERVRLVRALECVDAALIAVDDDRTVCKTLSLLHPDIFTNGGDQTNNSIPEAKVCNELGITLIDGLGGKVQSSSWLLARSRGEDVKIKEDPNQ